jgi:heme exporter protein C
MSSRRSEDLARALLPGLTGPAMLVVLYLIFMVVPTERDQGIVQRIFYFHVPSAWTAFLAFFVVCGASVAYLLNGKEHWDLVARASAEVGMVFCTLVLLTGPIWARPIWGTWWTWDPRLTMTMVLWTIYASYLLLRSYGAEEQEQISRYAAVLGIVGAIDIPLIVVSVRLWRGIHPAVMMSRDPQGGLRDPMMGVTLMAAGVTFVLVYAWLLLVRMRWLRISEQIERLQRRERGF